MGECAAFLWQVFNCKGGFEDRLKVHPSVLVVVPLVKQIVQVVQHLILEFHLPTDEANILRSQDIVSCNKVVLYAGDELIVDSQHWRVLIVAVQHNLETVALPEGLELEQHLRQLGFLDSLRSDLLDGFTVPGKFNFLEELRSKHLRVHILE